MINLIRVGILSIARSIIPGSTSPNVRRTLVLNSSNVSLVMFLSIASFSKVSLTTLKIFYIGFRSGERAGILKSSLSVSCKAFIAALDVCEESLSITNLRDLFLFGPARPKQRLKCSLMKLAKNFPFNFSYGSLSITPCLYAIATMTCRRFPPAKSFEP